MQPVLAYTRANSLSRCRSNMASIRQSRLDSGRGVQVKLVKTFSLVPSSLGSGSLPLALSLSLSLSPHPQQRSPAEPSTVLASLLQVLDSRSGITRAEDALGTPTQSHISPSILVYEEKASYNHEIAVATTVIMQEYLAHKEPPPPRNLQQAYVEGPMVVLGGGVSFS